MLRGNDHLSPRGNEGADDGTDHKEQCNGGGGTSFYGNSDSPLSCEVSDGVFCYYFHDGIFHEGRSRGLGVSYFYGHFLAEGAFLFLCTYGAYCEVVRCADGQVADHHALHASIYRFALNIASGRCAEVDVVC